MTVTLLTFISAEIASSALNGDVVVAEAVIASPTMKAQP